MALYSPVHVADLLCLFTFFFIIFFSLLLSCSFRFLLYFPFLFFSPFIYPFPCTFVQIIIEASRTYPILGLTSFSRFASKKKLPATNRHEHKNALERVLTWCFGGNRMPATHLLTNLCVVFLVHAETLVQILLMNIVHLNLVASLEPFFNHVCLSSIFYSVPFH
jgi:hypothetical protein